MSTDQKGCTDRNECLDLPCMNGASCINLEPKQRYRCVCLDGFWGENCQLVQEGQTLKLSMGALAAILVCLLVILSEHLNNKMSKNDNTNYNKCSFLIQFFVCFHNIFFSVYFIHFHHHNYYSLSFIVKKFKNLKSIQIFHYILIAISTVKHVGCPLN